jgi:acyl-CoA reductase-like NAD-dependent aldehyde dehydrogenase
VLGITPFNFPLNLLCHKVRPALAVGCPIIVKPAPASPLTALCFAELLEELGLPLGWVQVIPCENEVVEALVHHRDVAMVTFTGSPNVGWSIRSNVPRKRVSLEVGNNAPVIIEPDADCETVARKIGVAGYSFAGQSCVSTQRVLVHASLASEFLDALTSEVSRLGVGDPNEAGTVVSSLITTAATERVRGWIREAVGEGARLVVGGVCETRC